jgi:hypothetical protein
MYNGESYVFRSGEKTPISFDAARHMFGFGNPDKTDTLVRLGWAMKYDAAVHNWVENPEGIKRLSKFIFTKAVVTEEIAEPESVDASVTIV